MLIETTYQDKLFSTVLATETGLFIKECLILWQNYPEIRISLSQDLDRHGLKKKHQRERERQFALSRNLCLYEQEADEPAACSLDLQTGRPRFPEEIIFVLAMLCSKDGSVCAARTLDHLRESQSVASLLEKYEVKMPRRSTLAEHLKAISEETWRVIHRCQLDSIMAQGADDFSSLTADSTAAGASSAWPTDSKLLHRLLERALRLGALLPQWGLKAIESKVLQKYCRRLHVLDFAIAQNLGRKQSARKTKKTYRRIYLLSTDSAIKLLGALKDRFEQWEKTRGDYSPVKRDECDEVLVAILHDVKWIIRTIDHSKNRIEYGIKTPSTEKLLSLADESAAYIEKGGREPVIGYKAQLGRSEKGFVTAFMLEAGNGADSKAFAPLVREAISNTGKVPFTVSTDDGYPSRAGWCEVLDMGVEHVSFSGSKGKTLLGDELWNDPLYVLMRRSRSAVESLIFTLKHNHGFGRMGRRGLDAVRCEMLGKIVAYNLCQLIRLRWRKAKEPPALAA